MSNEITGKRVAILATDGFEQSELLEPKRMLEEAGAKTTIVSIKDGEIKGWNHSNWGETVQVDRLVGDCSAEEFDALMLPGGVISPDKLRMNEEAVDFVADFFEAGKPIGAICHGPWLLVEADVVSGCRVTSWPSVRTDLENAGADWVDEEVVVDQGLVTSRKPDDIPAFASKLIEEIREGVHSERESETGSQASLR
jgi:protease I